MTRQQVSAILTEYGYKLKIETDKLLEDKGYYEAYKMIQRTGDIWQYGTFRFEREPTPYFKVEKEFDTEDKAIKYCLMRFLKSHYMNRYGKFTSNYSELDYIYKNFDIAKLESVLKKSGIPQTYYCFGADTTGVINAVQLVETEKGYFLTTIRAGHQLGIISVSDSDGNGLPLWQASLSAVQKIYLYYMYDTELVPMFRKHGVLDEMTDEDFLNFYWW